MGVTSCTCLANSAQQPQKRQRNIKEEMMPTPFSSPVGRLALTQVLRRNCRLSRISHTATQVRRSAMGAPQLCHVRPPTEQSLKALRKGALARRWPNEAEGRAALIRHDGGKALIGLSHGDGRLGLASRSLLRHLLRRWLYL